MGINNAEFKSQSTAMMSEQLAKKRGIHGSHKVSATRIIQHIDDVIAAGDSESTVEIDTK